MNRNEIHPHLKQYPDAIQDPNLAHEMAMASVPDMKKYLAHIAFAKEEQEYINEIGNSAVDDPELAEGIKVSKDTINYAHHLAENSLTEANKTAEEVMLDYEETKSYDYGYREYKLFAKPFPRIQGLGYWNSSYNDLFPGETPAPQAGHEFHHYSDEEIYDKFADASEDKLKIAVDADPLLRRIIADHADLTGGITKETVHQLTGNKSLRLAVGHYLLAKTRQLAQQGAFAARINADGFKKSGVRHDIYQSIKNMTSTEYTALLALSMLDGSFDTVTGSIDVRNDDNGRVTQGQHRHAADVVLASDLSQSS